jgi:transposase InsO family protein
MLSDIFTVHGYLYIMVSDNVTIFASDHFKSYCGQNGIFQKFIVPGHPATDELAERNVQTLKTRLEAMANKPFSMHAKVREFFFRYRATPLSNNKTPAEMYPERNIRIQLDAIRPMEHVQNNDHAFKSRQLSVGQRVQIRCYIKNQAVRKLGTIIKKFGKPLKSESRR